MLGLIWAMGAALLLTASAGFMAEGATPMGTFACRLLSAEQFDGNTDNLIPSSIGEITLDGSGGYTQGMGAGTVVFETGALRFTSGNLSGTVAVVRHDAKGRRYLHIDGTVMNAPQGEPKFGDHICSEK